MSHLSDYLPRRVELMAQRVKDYGTEVVPIVAGRTVRNNVQDGAVRRYEISMPLMAEDDDDFIDTQDLFDDAGGGLNTFNFHDFTDSSDGTVVKVRFDTPFQTTSIGGGLHHIDTFSLVEELDEIS